MKPCPDCVVTAGAMMVRARHAMKSAADADKVKVPYGDLSAFGDAYVAIEKAIAELASPGHGIMEMEFGPGLVQWEEARAALLGGNMPRAYAHILAAHNEFRQVLDRHHIENPNNEQIARVIGLANWR